MRSFRLLKRALRRKPKAPAKTVDLRMTVSDDFTLRKPFRYGARGRNTGIKYY